MTLIDILSTGGTIACTSTAEGLVPTLSISDLMIAAGLHSPSPGVQITGREVASMDSSAMGLADIITLAREVEHNLKHSRPAPTGIVITHGTDSMEETAIALDLLLDTQVPVVLTGAQRPFDAPDYDGIANLRAAVAAAADPTHQGRVVIAFGGRVLPARGLFKAHTQDLSPFQLRAKLSPRRLPAATRARAWKNLARMKVPIIASWPGATELPLDLSQHPDGLVIQGLGSGNVSPAMGVALRKLHLPVVMATRVPYGVVSLDYGGPGGGSTLQGTVLPAGGLSASQARITLAIALAGGIDPRALFPG